VKVVCNASPLIILGRIDRFDLLPALFGVIHISNEVFQEVAISGTGRPAADSVLAANWIQKHPSLTLAEMASWRSQARLGAGELATIALAKTMAADWVILDERAARQLAIRHQLPVIGCVGILELAFRRKLVADLRSTYAQMQTQGVFIAPAILNQSLATFGLPAL
jgi:predicted nucleic acid-binding protein